MLTDFETLRTDDTLAAAVQQTLRGTQRDFPVLEWGRVAGVLTRNDLLSALADHGEEYPVRSTMRRSFPTAEPSEMLGPAWERIYQSGIGMMAVVLEGRLLGLVTLDHVREYLILGSVLRQGGDELESSDVSVSDPRTRRAS
jgi:predicted transcriptional regulator